MKDSAAKENPFIQFSKKRGLLLIAILAALQFIFAIDYILVLPLGPKIMASLKIGTIEYGLLISVYTISAAIMGFLSSFFIDSYPRKNILIIALLLFMLGNVCFVLSNSFLWIICSRILTGAFGGILSSLVMIYLGDLFPKTKLGRNTSTIMISNAMAAILGIPVALFITETYSWQFPFAGMLLINALVLILCIIYIPNISAPIKKKARKKLWHFVNNPKFLWPILFMSMLTFAGGATILPYLSTFVMTNLNFTNADVSFIFFCGGIAALLVNLFIGFFIDQYGRQNTFLLINFISIIPIILLTLSPFDDKVIVLFITTFFFGTSTARNVSGVAYLNSLMPHENRGRYVTINNSIQLMASSIATMVSGWLLYTENHLIVNFDLLGIIAICATITCIFSAFVLEE
jgi:predicted MFS family arabinose efflux permease